MRRILSVVLALSCTIGICQGAMAQDTVVEAYHLNQPINREILPKDQMPMNQPTVSQEESVYNDPYISYQWATTQIGADDAWEAVDDGDGVVVAVVDSGVDYTHEDLENRVLVDLGYDFVNNDTDPMDDNGHGTHVAGIIAAEANNGVGIAGVAGTLDVSILPIKVLNSDGEGDTSDIAAGILYAVEMDVDIINLSLGADFITPDVRNAIEVALDADIFVVVAAGNDGTTCSQLSLANLEGVFTVGASTTSDTIADFSNYGSCIDTYAPGEGILSTYLDNQYAYQDGTSMAAPIVSGAAAVLLSQDPTLTNDELTALLSTTTSTTTDQTSGNPTMVVIATPTNGQPIFRTHAMPNNGPFTASAMSTSCTTVNLYDALMTLLG